jgi:serine/threonine protein kinase
VHRDLKPENLFVSELESARPFVRILDFGIAKVLDSSHVSTDLKGTPLYMAPEQVRGRRVSPQTDVWALGLIAYYLLTGKVYWLGAYGENPNLLGVLEEIGRASRTVPSLRLREQGIEAEVPPAFDEWLLRCLEADSARRFGSAGQAVEALGPALGESFRAGAKAGRAPMISGHSVTDLASASPTSGTEKSLAPVQSAPALPVKRSRTLIYVGAATAGLIGLAIAVGSSRGPSEEETAADSVTKAPDEVALGTPSVPAPIVAPEVEPPSAPATASSPSASSAAEPSSIQPPAPTPSPKRAAPPATSRPSVNKTPAARTKAPPARSSSPAPSARTFDAFDLR